MLVVKPEARSAGSLSDLDIEYSELKVAIEKLAEENKHLRRSLIESEKDLVAMRQNRNASGGEAEILQRQVQQMKLRMDALGIDTAASANTKLEQRLLTAVSDLRVAAVERKRMSESLVRLSEAAAFYAKSTVASDPQSRLSLETEIRNATAALSESSSNAAGAGSLNPSVNNGAVISVEEDLALVVMNLGTTHSVKVGMPFQIVRGEKIIGNVRTVDVREKIAGAVIQNLSSEKDPIKVGDHLRVATQQ